MTEANPDSARLDRLWFRPSSGRIHPSVLSVRSVVKLFLLIFAEFLESGSLRSGSNIGSSRSSTEVSGRKLGEGTERSFCKADCISFLISMDILVGDYFPVLHAMGFSLRCSPHSSDKVI